MNRIRTKLKLILNVLYTSTRIVQFFETIKFWQAFCCHIWLTMCKLFVSIVYTVCLCALMGMLQIMSCLQGLMDVLHIVSCLIMVSFKVTQTTKIHFWNSVLEYFHLMHSRVLWLLIPCCKFDSRASATSCHTYGVHYHTLPYAFVQYHTRFTTFLSVLRYFWASKTADMAANIARTLGSTSIRHMGHVCVGSMSNRRRSEGPCCLGIFISTGVH